MEDSQVLSLLDQLNSPKEAPLAPVIAELVDRFRQHLSVEEASEGLSEDQMTFQAYIWKRLLNGSTSDESTVQDR